MERKHRETFYFIVIKLQAPGQTRTGITRLKSSVLADYTRGALKYYLCLVPELD